ncbi:MAG: hypothetical protein EXS15_00390 [Phycisphaerales bacterium]|nr:hypothetical protein [Phycisphaerales bacterium]
MKEHTRNFVTGIFAIIGCIGFAFLLLLFGPLTRSVQSSYSIAFHANQAQGLRKGSQLTLAGVPIGEITEVIIVIDRPLPVQISASILGSIDLPLGVQASVINALIGGTATLDLTIPPGYAETYAQGGAILPRDGSAVIQANFEGLEERITRVLEERMGGVDAAMKSVSDLAQEAQKWLSDEQLLADTKSAMWKAQAMIEQATGAMLAVTEAARGIEGNSNRIAQSLHTALATSFQPALDQLSKTLAQIESLSKQASEGTGTVGQLMSNPDLYNALNDSAQRLKSTLGEVDLLLQKVRAEGLGVKF